MLKFFAEKKKCAVQKLLTFFFQQKISEYCILNPLKQLTKWPLTSSLINANDALNDWTQSYCFFLITQ